MQKEQLQGVHEVGLTGGGKTKKTAQGNPERPILEGVAAADL